MNRIIGLVLALVVGGLLVGGLLIPSIEGMTATEKTFENEGYFNLTKYTAADSVTFSWDYNNPDEFIVNGESVTYHNDTGLSVSVVLGTYFAIRIANDNANLGYFGWGQYVTANATTPTLTFVFENGGISVTNGTVTKTANDVTEIYTISEDGPYVMKKSASVAYLNSGSEIIADSEIYASGQTFNGNAYISWHMEGTIDNMQYPDSFTTNLTISDEQIHGKYSTICDDLYELSNITFVATNSNNVVFNVTASYFVVPATVTADLTNPLDPTQIAMFGVISILGIVALVVVAANSIRNKY